MAGGVPGVVSVGRTEARMISAALLQVSTLTVSLLNPSVVL